MKLNYRSWLVLVFLLLVGVGCRQEVLQVEPQSNEKATSKLERDVAGLLSVPMTGQQVSLKQALNVVQRKENSLRGLQDKNILSTTTLYTSSGNPALYVVNFSPEGYAILSASRKCTPVLAHNSKGVIVADDKESPIASLLEEYIKRVEYANTLPDSLTRLATLQWEMFNNQKLETLRSIDYDEDMYHKVSETISKYLDKGYRVYRYSDIMGEYKYAPPGERDQMPPSWEYNPRRPGDYVFEADCNLLDARTKYEINETIDLIVSKVYSVNSHVLILIREKKEARSQAPLLSTLWSQGWYPETDKDREEYSKRITYNMFIQNYYVVGCVGIAVAQIMRHHKYPNQFDWSAMLDNEPTIQTAKFLSEVACEVKTKFGRKSSSDIKYVIPYLRGLNYTTVELSGKNNHASILFYELDSENPIYVQGADLKAEVAHAFVIDGYMHNSSSYEVKVLALPDAPANELKNEQLGEVYSKNYFSGESSLFHINLGWGLGWNGYHTLDNFLTYNDYRKYLLITPPKR